jgi:hypothetical protein
MNARARPEQLVHKAVVAHLKTRAVAGLVFLHPANGGARTAIEGAILKGLGVVAGAPDLILFHGGKSFAIELKTEDGRVTEAQVEMLTRLKDAGVLTAVCHGIDRAIEVLESWQLLRGSAQ